MCVVMERARLSQDFIHIYIHGLYMSRAMYVALIGSNKDIFKKWKVFGSYLYYFPFPPFCLNEDGSLDMQDHSSDVPGFCKIMFRADGFSDVQLEGK